jgi:Flp pilus assembly protein TadB
MPEPLAIASALAAGGCASVTVLASRRPARPTVAWPRWPQLDDMRPRLALELDRAGWHESPERVAVLTAAVSSGLASLGLASVLLVEPGTAVAFALLGAISGVAAVAFRLRAAVTARRSLCSRELVPLLELFLLELSGGGSALSALGSVTLQVDSDLAVELRRLLIASQVAGSASFEPRLRDFADHMQIPALHSLATILTASREYGIGVSQGVRALTTDLRRAQRRELIAHSRRALNHVLFPAAIGVLLPFLAILLFPAISSLQRNLP